MIAPPQARKTRGELMKDIDADYYGYRDDDDGLLIPLEQEMEQKGRETENKCGVILPNQVASLVTKMSS